MLPLCFFQRIIYSSQALDLIPCFSPDSYIIGDLQQLTLTAVLIPHPNANAFCQPADGYSSNITLNFYSAISYNSQTLTTMDSPTFIYNKATTNRVVFPIDSAALLYKILALNAISYTAQLASTSTSGVFQTPQFTQTNSTSCWDQFNLVLNAQKGTEYISVEGTPNFCSFPQTATDFKVFAVVGTVKIEIKPKAAPGVEEYYSLAYGDYVGYHHLSTKKFHQLCADSDTPEDCYKVVRNFSSYAGQRVYLQLQFTYLGLSQIIRADVTVFTTPTTAACKANMGTITNVLNYKNFAFKYDKLTVGGPCSADADKVLLDIVIFADTKQINMHKQITLDQLILNDFQVFETEDNFEDQLLLASISYQLQFVYFKGNDIQASQIFQNSAYQSCVKVKNLYTSTSSIVFEFAPISKQSCRKDSPNIPTEIRFIVNENGLDVVYGIFKTIATLPFAKNMSNIEFSCDDDIGDATLSIKGTCTDRFNKFKKAVEQQKSVAFTFGIPNKFDYSNYAYSEDFNNVYYSVAGFCGGILLIGAVFLGILISRSRRKDD
ncbi:Conserved_hypothetical protein [Hexamita inflata]|uniref:SbsA Ig-like domain-containing protein n=1 Tax=Hexamita inflata TaxID=28002 RepID=A0ABP1I346_9EUKA